MGQINSKLKHEDDQMGQICDAYKMEAHYGIGNCQQLEMRCEESAGLWEQRYKTKQTPWPLVRERTIPTEGPPLRDGI
jgi:hypothetical protein